MIFKKQLMVSICLIFVSFLIQGCSKQIGNSSISVNNSKGTFTAESSLKELKVEVKPDMVFNVLKIRSIRVSDGELSLRLISPDGTVQWEESFNAPANFKKSYSLEADPGVWVLEIELKDATGKYDISWKASN